MMKPENFDTNVFINCALDEAYRPLLWSMVFSIIACGYQPCLALQERDAGVIRLEKIKRLINSSRLGIHDISRTAPISNQDCQDSTCLSNSAWTSAPGSMEKRI